MNSINLEEIYKRRFTDTNKVFSIKIIIKDEAKPAYGDKGRYGVVTVITNQFAIAQYQAKFSKFSKEYKNYISQYMADHRNDDGIIYLPTMFRDNGESLTGDKKIRALYDVPELDIAKVELTKQETCCGTNVSVIITTKK